MSRRLMYVATDLGTTTVVDNDSLEDSTATWVYFNPPVTWEEIADREFREALKKAEAAKGYVMFIGEVAPKRLVAFAFPVVFAPEQKPRARGNNQGAWNYRKIE